MADTYCGKNCEQCARLQKRACPGCKEGPGRLLSGNCELAKCCRDKGCTACADCGQNEACAMLRGPENIPEHRVRNLALKTMKKHKVLRRWLTVLFWLLLCWIIFQNFLSILDVSGLFPSVASVMAWSEVVFYAAGALLLLRLSSECGRYRTAGLCQFAVAAVCTAICFVSAGTTAHLWFIAVLNLARAIFLLLGNYQEFTGHAEVVYGVSAKLSAKWGRLWSWNAGLIGGVLLSVSLAMLSPAIGGVLMLIMSVLSIVLGVFRLVYLYQTAARFRIFSAGKR